MKPPVQAVLTQALRKGVLWIHVSTDSCFELWLDLHGMHVDGLASFSFLFIRGNLLVSWD